ncbi:MAG: metal-dependent transcriptional regulator [Clostridia bacterium]
MIHQSGEDYLETILLLKREKGYVRSIDIATKLGYSKPSISRAMTILKKENFIVMDEKGYITLTDIGMEMAQKIYLRHETITQFLVKSLNLDEKIAEDDACKIEHVISEETLMKMQDYIKDN